MQEREYQKNIKLMNELEQHHRSYATIDILRSKDIEDLFRLRGYSSDLNNLPSEMYPLLVEYATEYAAKYRDKLCYDLSDGWDPNAPCSCAEYPDCDCKEGETPEEEKARLEQVEKWRKMSPKDFWIMMNG